MELESDNDGEFDDDYDYYNTGERVGATQEENSVQGRFVQLIDYTHAIDLKHTTHTIAAF